jgi:hemerythrin-like domain-containing protein
MAGVEKGNFMQLFDLLRKDHDQVKAVLTKLINSRASAKTRQSGLERLTSLLMPHMRAEESLLYPQLVERGSEDLGLEAMEEHRVARRVLDELRETAPEEPIWKARCTVLSELLNHHIEEEESDVFEAVDDSFSQDEQQAIAKQVQAFKRQGRKAA